MKTLRQIKDLINNMAKKKNINPQILMRNYMLESSLPGSFSEVQEDEVMK